MGDAHTLAELKAINNALSGTLTLNDVTVALSGSTADVKAALAGSFASGYTGNVTLSDNHTLSELKAINDATTGSITLNSSAVALSGTSSDVTAALDGFTNYTGNVTLTDTHNLAQLKSINNATSGEITLNSYSVDLSGSASDVSDALAGTFASSYTGNVSLNTDHTLSQLKTISNGTSGQITLNDYTVALSGSSADLATALGGTFASAYTGDVATSDAHNLAQLKAINNATSGTITLNDATGVSLSGSISDIKAALAGTITANYTGNITINGTLNYSNRHNNY